MPQLLQLIKSHKQIKTIYSYLNKTYNTANITVYGITKHGFRYNIIYHTLYCLEEKESYLLIGLVDNILYLIRILKTDPSVGFVIV